MHEFFSFVRIMLSPRGLCVQKSNRDSVFVRMLFEQIDEVDERFLLSPCNKILKHKTYRGGRSE